MKLTKTRLAAGGLLAAFAVAGAIGGSVAYAGTTGAGNTVTIDAAKDKDAAGKAMQLLDKASDRSFTPTSNPAYSQTGWELASDKVLNNPPSQTKDAELEFEARHTETSSWNVGTSVGGSLEAALGVADLKLSVKFTAEQQWGTDATRSEGILATAKPGKTVWIVASNSQATFTGNYTFTAEGTTYHVNNVTITQPAPDPKSGGDRLTATTYMAMEQPYAAVNGSMATPAGGPVVSASELPKVTTITQQLPKLQLGQ